MEQVPLNALEFQVRLKQPIVVTEHSFHLLDAQGQKVEGAVPEWTWDAAFRVATLRLVGVNAGERYWIIGEGLRFSEEEPSTAWSMPLMVVAADHQPPDGANIDVQGRPYAKSRNPITVGFSEAIRWQSLHAMNVLVDGRPVDGEWSLLKQQTQAWFTPTQPWSGGKIHVSIAAGVSDLAGNELANKPMGMLTPMVSLNPKDAP